MTHSPPLAAIILAAGKGTRMKAPLAKVLYPVANRPMIGHVLAAVEELAPERQTVVLSPGQNEVADFVAPRPIAIQDPPLGTAHAVLAARPALEGFKGDILILYADTPLVEAATLRRLRAALHEPAETQVAVLTFRPDDASEYGRVILDADGSVARIVEHRDANAEVRAVGLCNAGMIAVTASDLWSLLERVGNANAKKEYYLTDIVGLARRSGLRVACVEALPEEVMGVNSQLELASAEAALQTRLRRRWMEAGVTMIAPETVWLSADTRLAPGVTIEPNVVFGPGVTVGEGVAIKAFSHISGATIGKGASVGPFARLRPDTVLGESARIGNFVEVKNARLGPGAKANHLTYLGDAEIGADANIGAGTITCNYDGYEKASTEIGEGAFIGSNTALVAPVRIGAGAIVGAGSVITREVAPDALAVARGKQEQRAGWARVFRERKRKMQARGKTRSKG
ncbi:MAG TPA: bifunctional UDP-N-acetylglucosamine diphosphorylase/glucosamine-1-phosphate N-acetyltransferase GlmU [Alphaproteobacteria bacterium]|nr:bifunctional UDP-N-acetylglucosamine diphosphorylase/glucosamine-1-phosphate N-acetyltransferase GlmU [Alphaproteobacteria bacterium]